MGLFSPYTCKFISKVRHGNEKTSQNYQVFLDYYGEKLGTSQCMIEKSFAIGTFPSSSLIKERMMISDKKKKTLCGRVPSPNQIAKQAGVLSTKSPVLKKGTTTTTIFIMLLMQKCCDGRFFHFKTNLRLNGNSVLDSR